MNRALLSGWTKLVGSNAASAVMQFAAFAIAARALDLAVLGMLVIIQTYVRVVDGLFNFQSVNVLTRFLAEAQEDGDDRRFAGLIKAGFLVDFGTAVLATVIAIIALPLLGPIFGITDEWTILAMQFSLVVLTRIFGVTEAALRCFDKFWSIGLRTTVNAAILLIGSAAAWYYGAGAKTFLYVWMGAEAAANVGFILWAVIVLRRRHPVPIASANAGEAIAASRQFWPMMWQTNATFAIRMFSQDADVLVAGSVLGPAAASLLRAAKSLSTLVGQAGRPLQQVASAPLSRMAAKSEYAALRSYSGQVCSLALLGGLAITLGMLLLGRDVLGLAFGPEFAAAYWVTVILFLSRSFYLGGVTLLPMMLALDIGGKFLRAVVIGTLAYAAILAFAVEPLGLVGIGLAHIGFELGWAASGWLMSLRKMRQLITPEPSGAA